MLHSSHTEVFAICSHLILMSQQKNAFADEYRDEAQKKGGFKDLGDAVGMPDKEDWKNIVSIIEVTRKACIKKYGFDILVDCIANARKDRTENDNKYGKLHLDYGLVNKDSNMRHVMELPEEFMHAIEKGYPIMFSNRDHFSWFCRNFKELLIGDKY